MQHLVDERDRDRPFADGWGPRAWRCLPGRRRPRRLRGGSFREDRETGRAAISRRPDPRSKDPGPFDEFLWIERDATVQPLGAGCRAEPEGSPAPPLPPYPPGRALAQPFVVLAL